MSKKHPENTKPRMKRKEYEKELRKLQTELCLLQQWVVHKGLRVIVPL
jgi:polyphosphate kinase